MSAKAPIAAAQIQPLAVDADGAAALLNVSKRSIENWHSRGYMPDPVPLPSGVTRWSVAELRSWVAAGCTVTRPNSSPELASASLTAARWLAGASRVAWLIPFSCSNRSTSAARWASSASCSAKAVVDVSSEAAKKILIGK